MSWLGDFVGGITGKSQQDAVKKAAGKSNKKANEYRDESLAALDTANKDILALLPTLQGGKDAAFAGIEDLLKRVFGEIDRGNNAVGGLYDQAITETAGGGAAGRAAIEQAFQDAVRTGSASVQKGLAGTGMGNSSLVGSRIARSVIPNAVGGKMNALAALEDATASRVASLRGEKARALTGRQNAGTQVLTDTLGRKVDLGERYFGQEMALRGQPIQNNLNAKVQPGVIYPNLQFPAAVSGASALGSTLGGIGAGAAGAFTNNYFGSLGSNMGGGNQSVQELIEALKSLKIG